MIPANYRSVDEAKNFLLHSYEYSPAQERRKHALQLKAFEYIEIYTDKNIQNIIDRYIDDLSQSDKDYNYAVVTVNPWDIWETKAQILIADFRYISANIADIRGTDEYKFDELFIVKEWLDNIAPKYNFWLGKPFEYTYKILTDKIVNEKYMQIFHDGVLVGRVFIS